MAIDEVLLEFEYEWREGDRDKVRAIAKEYIKANYQIFSPILGPLTLEEIVKKIDGYREAGRHADRLIADMWLHSEYEPQNISGALNIGGRQVAEALDEALRRGEKI